MYLQVLPHAVTPAERAALSLDVQARRLTRLHVLHLQLMHFQRGCL
jgi:hypothetical protein